MLLRTRNIAVHTAREIHYFPAALPALNPALFLLFFLLLRGPRVQHDVVSGLKYVQGVYRKGIRGNPLPPSPRPPKHPTNTTLSALLLCECACLCEFVCVCVCVCVCVFVCVKGATVTGP